MYRPPSQFLAQCSEKQRVAILEQIGYLDLKFDGLSAMIEQIWNLTDEHGAMCLYDDLSTEQEDVAMERHCLRRYLEDEYGDVL